MFSHFLNKIPLIFIFSTTEFRSNFLRFFEFFFKFLTYSKTFTKIFHNYLNFLKLLESFFKNYPESNIFLKNLNSLCFVFDLVLFQNFSLASHFVGVLTSEKTVGGTQQKEEIERQKMMCLGRQIG